MNMRRFSQACRSRSICRFSSEALKSATQEMMVPVWWSGTPSYPLQAYGIDCAQYDMRLEPDELPEVVEQIHETFKQTGLAYLYNTKLEQLGAMSKWANVLVPSSDYQGGANSRGELTKNVFDTGAPKEAHLHYHHEMAYVSKSVLALAFCANKAVVGKGEMYVSDNLVATDAILATEMGQKLKDKGICYIRCLTDRDAWSEKEQSGIYNHWQRSFGSDSAEEVERLATQAGLKYEWGPDRFLKTKCYISGFEYFPQLDRNVLYSSVADDALWFDTWPGVCELPTMPSYAQVNADHRPLKITYGDDTDFTPEELQQFIDVYDKSAIPISWKVGDVLTVCNYRWAHGRPSYTLEGSEERNLGVVLGEKYDRLGQLDDKW